MVIEGPLAPLAAGMAERLRELGYAPGSTANHLALVARLSCHLKGQALSANDIGPVVLEQFCSSLRRCRGSSPTPKTFVWLVEFLRDIGVEPPAVGELPRSEADKLIERYRQFLLSERGLAADTVENYLRALGPFLTKHADRPLWDLSAGDVSRFMTSQCRQLSPRSLERLATSLRSFLGFALQEGLIATPLRNGVPSAARWSVAGLPRGLAPTEVTTLLASCDRTTPTGRRDYAIVVLMVRLGLRAAEVAALRLDDIDWRAGEILVRGKGHSEERLPLPSAVGKAIAAYLRRGRPRRPEREVFIRASAPLRGLSPDGVSEVVRAASERAGLGSFGAHRLRHTAGTQMLRDGASLTEVAQVLRHRRVATTAIYAKVDHRALRSLARPWPGSVR
jgi:integrase/recombinase XerD